MTTVYVGENAFFLSYLAQTPAPEEGEPGTGEPDTADWNDLAGPGWQEVQPAGAYGPRGRMVARSLHEERVEVVTDKQFLMARLREVLDASSLGHDPEHDYVGPALSSMRSPLTKCSARLTFYRLPAGGGWIVKHVAPVKKIEVEQAVRIFPESVRRVAEGFLQAAGKDLPGPAAIYGFLTLHEALNTAYRLLDK